MRAPSRSASSSPSANDAWWRSWGRPPLAVGPAEAAFRRMLEAVQGERRGLDAEHHLTADHACGGAFVAWQGNDAFRKQDYDEAIHFYGEAMNVSGSGIRRSAAPPVFAVGAGCAGV